MNFNAKSRSISFWASAVGILFLVTFPTFMDSFRISQMGQFLTYALLAISLNLMWGYTGILSLGHGVFFVLGGYAVGYYLKLQTPGLPDFMGWSGLSKIPWFIQPFHYAWFALPFIVLLPMLFGLLVGWPAFRSGIKGVYFTILSQALALALMIFFIGQQPYTGGTNGITNFQGFFGLSLRSPLMVYGLYYLSLIFVALGILLNAWLMRVKTGKILMAVRDSENRLRFLGYDPASFKLFVFVLSAGMAGVAGALCTTQIGIVSPAGMDILPSVEIAIWVAIGGRGTLAGPVIGALFVSMAKEFFSENFPSIWLYFIGLAFILTVLFFPKGLMGLRELSIWNKFKLTVRKH
jgi:urea transport system permease protein